MVSDLSEQIRRTSASLSVARDDFPQWTEVGMADHSCAIHSMGVSYWTRLGNVLGYLAVSELPPPPGGRYAHVGDDIRSDSVWFGRDDLSPAVVVEFERYGGAFDEAKLLGKVQNLLLAFHRWDGSPRIAVLSYWTKGLATTPSHDLLKRRFIGGFETAARERVPGAHACELLIWHTVLRETSDGTWRLWQMIERGG